MSQGVADVPAAGTVARRPVSLTSEARARTRFAWLLLLPTLVVVALVALVPCSRRSG